MTEETRLLMNLHSWVTSELLLQWTKGFGVTHFIFIWTPLHWLCGPKDPMYPQNRTCNADFIGLSWRLNQIASVRNLAHSKCLKISMYQSSVFVLPGPPRTYSTKGRCITLLLHTGFWKSKVETIVASTTTVIIAATLLCKTQSSALAMHPSLSRAI